jgi:hypothetical protein
MHACCIAKIAESRLYASQDMSLAIRVENAVHTSPPNSTKEGKHCFSVGLKTQLCSDCAVTVATVVSCGQDWHTVFLLAAQTCTNDSEGPCGPKQLAKLMDHLQDT